MSSSRKHDTDRRQFLKKTCGAGIGMVASASGLNNAWAQKVATESAGLAQMPLRPFGKTGVKIPILGLGGSLNLINQQLLLAQALKMGVTFWDTADNYSGGRSEGGIGKYFAKHPEDRQRVFLATKTSSATPAGMDRSLAGSLERLKTDYVDLYLIHGLSSVDDEIDGATRQWVAKAKDDGRIRFFGFSTHSNMASCLAQAARLEWIDGIMLTYNYRLVDDDAMKQAVNACVRAGIGLIAMKTQGRAFSFKGGGGDLVQRFLERGMTPYQARLKAVWENSRFTSICSHMDNMTILKENVAAAQDGQTLTDQERLLLKRHAKQTASVYCPGCGDICENLIDDRVPVADLMRCLMYAHNYNDYQMARAAFAKLPPDMRTRLFRVDYTAAEKRCPQRIAIGKFMRLAAGEIG